MEKISVLAITKNGIKIGLELKELFPKWQVFAPQKLATTSDKINWYEEPTTDKIVKLFKSCDGLVCLFSLGAVIRLIAPHLVSKKTDPAVMVIDDKKNFVISVLSGHIGGANELASEIAEKIGATPVITTAADVNKTIAVDLVGKEFGWKIDDDSNVTKVSAYMVNDERIGVYQDAGNARWWKNELPRNVKFFEDLDSMKSSDCKGYLIITDKILDGDFLNDAVVYRPPSLVVGVGLHWDTSKHTIKEGLETTMSKFRLSPKSVARLVSIKKPKDVEGLIELGSEMNIPVEYVNREDLADIHAPNPSDTVKAYEGTASVSEAAAMKISGGKLVVEKQKFPPNLTIAIARIPK